MLKSCGGWVVGGGGLQDFIVSPSPLLGFSGLGTFGLLGFGDLRVWGLGLDKN